MHCRTPSSRNTSSPCLRAGLFAALSGLVLLGSVRPASADLFTVHQFTGPNGNQPNSLIQGKDGNFYGTTYKGGSNYYLGDDGYGEVFRLTPQGRLTKLVNFDLHNGNQPNGLILAPDGSFYGTTASTIFRLTTDGTASGSHLTTLHSFSNGSVSDAPLLQAQDGSFYGTTVNGGNSNNDGTVFRLTTDGTRAGTHLTTLYSFSNTVGISPNALVPAPDGSFYGSTFNDGSDYYGSNYGEGTVFHLATDGTAAGTDLTTLYNFAGPNGAELSALLLAEDGSLYGTALAGGAFDYGYGYGLVFHLTSALTPPDPVEAVTLPTTVNRGDYVTGEVTLKNIATIPVTVSLNCNDESALFVRFSVTVAPGHRHAFFTAQAGGQRKPNTVTISAASLSAAGIGPAKTTTVTVTP